MHIQNMAGWLVCPTLNKLGWRAVLLNRLAMDDADDVLEVGSMRLAEKCVTEGGYDWLGVLVIWCHLVDL